MRTELSDTSWSHRDEGPVNLEASHGNSDSGKLALESSGIVEERGPHLKYNAPYGNIDIAIGPWLHGHHGSAWAVGATILCCKTWTCLRPVVSLEFSLCVLCAFRDGLDDLRRHGIDINVVS